MIGIGVLAGAAFACGATVCSGTTTTTATGTTSTGGGPIVQSGERIVFVEEEDEWTAFVQIQTAGAPSEFGWVIPLPNDIHPDEVTIAPEGMMDDLEEATAPQFVTDDGTQTGANGPAEASCDSGCGGVPSLSDLLTVGAGQLLGSAVVGPYEISVVGRNDTEALAAWFLGGGYDLPLATWPLIDEYVAQDYSFLVVRLLPTQGSGQGTVDTLRIPCGQLVPAIPLKLTSVAAVSDMSITTWVVSNRRYEPANDWPEVDFDPTVVDPTAAPTDYAARLRSALDGSGGRGFRTEYAGSLEDLKRELDPETRNAIGLTGYVTRLQTWASPDEMLSDPEFVPSDGDDVDNVIDLRSGGAAGMGWASAALLAAVGIARRRRQE